MPEKELVAFDVILPNSQSVHVDIQPTRKADEIAKTIARKAHIEVGPEHRMELYDVSTSEPIRGTAKDIAIAFIGGIRIGIRKISFFASRSQQATPAAKKGKRKKIVFLVLLVCITVIIITAVFLLIKAVECKRKPFVLAASNNGTIAIFRRPLLGDFRSRQPYAYVYKAEVHDPHSPPELIYPVERVCLDDLAKKGISGWDWKGILTGPGFAYKGKEVLLGELKDNEYLCGVAYLTPPRSEDDEYLSRISVVDFGTVGHLNFLPDYVQLSPDGMAVSAIRTDQSTIQVMWPAEPSGSHPFVIEGATGLCWGPDNNTLLITKKDGLYACPLRAGIPSLKPLVSMPHPDSRLVAEKFYAPRLSPSGKEIAFLIHRPPPPTGNFRRSKLTWLCYMGLLDSSYTEVVTGDEEHLAPSYEYEWGPSEKGVFCLASDIIGSNQQIWFVPKRWHSEKTVLSDTEEGASKDGGETYSFGFIKCSPDGNGISFVRRTGGWETSSLCYYPLKTGKVYEICKGGVIGNWWADQGKLILFFTSEESKEQLKRSLWLTTATPDGASRKIVKLQDIEAFEDEYAEVSDYCDKTKTLVFYDVSAKTLRKVKLRFPENH